MKVSIIVPVYNAEKYLHNCLDSILSQSLNDFELLLIDDGSHDKSGTICDSYASDDPRIKVIHKENGGVSAARNIGLDLAKGDWIYFIDSDDSLADMESLERLLSLSTNVELAIGGLNKIDLSGNIRNESYESKDMTTDVLGFIVPFYQGDYGYQGFLVTKLFKRDIIQKHQVRFDPKIVFCEDMLFVASYLCCPEVKKIHLDNTVRIYDYYEREKSAMQSVKSVYNPKYITDFQAHEQMYYLFRGQSLHGSYYKLILEYGICQSYMRIERMMRFKGPRLPEQETYMQQVLKKVLGNVQYEEFRKKSETILMIEQLKAKARQGTEQETMTAVSEWFRSPAFHFRYATLKWKGLFLLYKLIGNLCLQFVVRKQLV